MNCYFVKYVFFFYSDYYFAILQQAAQSGLFEKHRILWTVPGQTGSWTFFNRRESVPPSGIPITWPSLILNHATFRMTAQQLSLQGRSCGVRVRQSLLKHMSQVLKERGEHQFCLQGAVEDREGFSATLSTINYIPLSQSSSRKVLSYSLSLDIYSHSPQPKVNRSNCFK